MTTSPFGTPLPAEPTRTAPEPTSSRRPLLLALGGVAAVAVLGVGGFVLLTGGEDEVLAPPPVASGPVVDDGPVLEELPGAQAPIVALSSRNPFAAQVVAGGEGAAATTPVENAGTTSPGSGSSSSGGSSSGGSSSGGSSSGTPTPVPGEKGETGAKGEAGAKGPKGDPGATGPAGADGRTPTWVTLTVDDVVEAAPASASFTIRDSRGENPVAGVRVDDPVYLFGPAVAVVVTGFDDIDSDGQVDRVRVSVVDAEDPSTTADYTLWLGQAVPLFFTP